MVHMLGNLRAEGKEPSLGNLVETEILDNMAFYYIIKLLEEFFANAHKGQRSLRKKGRRPFRLHHGVLTAINQKKKKKRFDWRDLATSTLIHGDSRPLLRRQHARLR